MSRGRLLKRRTKCPFCLRRFFEGVYCLCLWLVFWTDVDGVGQEGGRREFTRRVPTRIPPVEGWGRARDGRSKSSVR